MNINYFDCLATSPGHLPCDWLALRSVAIFMYTFNICGPETHHTMIGIVHPVDHGLHALVRSCGTPDSLLLTHGHSPIPVNMEGATTHHRLRAAVSEWVNARPSGGFIGFRQTLMSLCKASINLHGQWALAVLFPPASFTHDFQDENWDHPPRRPVTAAAAQLSCRGVN